MSLAPGSHHPHTRCSSLEYPVHLQITVHSWPPRLLISSAPVAESLSFLVMIHVALGAEQSSGFLESTLSPPPGKAKPEEL